MKTLRLFLCLTLCISLFSSCQVDDERVSTEQTLRIAYAEAPSNTSPLSYEAKNRKFLANLYEPLLTYDTTFNYETGLAVSWGRLDEQTWDFRLREGVVFHDGSPFEADDVVYSFELAMNDEASELQSLLSNIVSVERIDDYRVEITTELPDPLLLNKLTNIYMVPSAYDDFNIPNGTGPYRLTSYSAELWELERFDQYWGELPFFAMLELHVIPDLDSRVASLESGDIDILANVPPQYVSELESVGISIQSFPSLEVSFLMMNLDGVFSDEDFRSIVWNAIDDDYADRLGSGYLSPSSQFAASGITGFVGDLESRVRDLFESRDLLETYSGELSFQLDIPFGLEALGEEVQADLADIGIEVELNALDLLSFEERVFSGESDMYYFGWKYDLADVSDFYESVVHSAQGDYGAFNGLGYANESIDALIESSSVVLDVNERNAELESIAKQLLEDQVILPLFEANVLYGLQPDIYWNIRLDGQILASEIMQNMVE
jgi:peptide/nickel transport system substrate-binding protein